MAVIFFLSIYVALICVKDTCSFPLDSDQLQKESPSHPGQGGLHTEEAVWEYKYF